MAEVAITPAAALVIVLRAFLRGMESLMVKIGWFLRSQSRRGFL